MFNFTCNKIALKYFYLLQIQNFWLKQYTYPVWRGWARTPFAPFRWWWTVVHSGWRTTAKVPWTWWTISSGTFIPMWASWSMLTTVVIPRARWALISRARGPSCRLSISMRTWGPLGLWHFCSWTSWSWPLVSPGWAASWWTWPRWRPASVVLMPSVPIWWRPFNSRDDYTVNWVNR